MKQTYETGLQGENTAEAYLHDRLGMICLERRYRTHCGEIDLIMLDRDTIVFVEISRFTRECDNGYDKYMNLMHMGVNLVFIDNPIISTDYIKNLLDVANKQSHRIAKKALGNTIELLLLVELDRVEKEREIIIKRIKQGIAAEC